MNFSECESRGMIRKDPAAPARVTGSLETSARFLASAKNNLRIHEFEMTEIAAYNSAFHSARALLFSYGYVERSHACLVVALNHVARNDRKIHDMVLTFDKLRLSRHNVQYGGSLVKQEEAEYAVDFAGRFHDVISRRLE